MLNKKQKEFFEKAIRGENLFITGSAGVGKTFLIRAIIEEKKKEGKKSIICAPTGIAARSIGGYTIHNQFHLSPTTLKIREGSNKWIEKIDLIIIDEISMVPFYIFDIIGREIKRINPDCQIVVVGDFYQLPPVVTDKDLQTVRSRYRYQNLIPGEYHCFHSEMWKEFDFKTCVLDEAMRQSDQNFSTALFNLSRGKLTKEDCQFLRKAQLNSRNEEFVTICTTNKAANKINNDHLKSIKANLFTYEAHYWGEFDKEIEKIVNFKVGAKVMMTVNTEEYCNGDLGEIVGIKDNEIKVRLMSGEEVVVIPYEFKTFIANEEGGSSLIGSIEQFPIKLAWAITVHKSQGQTFNGINFDFKGWGIDGSQNLTLLYVGLSRSRSIETTYLSINEAVPPFTNQIVSKFYNGEFITYTRPWSQTTTIGF